MAHIRLRIHLFKGREEINLARLSAIPDELNKFLRAYGEDLGLAPAENVWRASSFHGGSLSMLAAPDADAAAALVARSMELGQAIALGEADKARELGASDNTLLQFSCFADSLKDDEECKLGFYASPQARRPSKWVRIRSDIGRNLTRDIQPRVQYEGAVFGTIHALYKEGDRPHFDLRDMAKGQLVKCYYDAEHYGEIVRALVVRDNRVHVSGRISASRMQRDIESVKVSRIRPAEPLSDDDFEKFIGCAPNLTGEMTTSEFISSIRDDGN